MIVRLIFIFLLLFAAAAHAQPLQAQPTSTPCQPAQLALSTDASDGGFAGMSQNGTLLLFRNRSAQPCTLEPFPSLSATGAHRLRLHFTPEQPNPFQGPLVNGKRLSMGHGPVVLPLVLAPGATASQTLHWVTGPVYDHNVCTDVRTVTVFVNGCSYPVPLGAHVCGPNRTGLVIKTSRLVIPTPDA